MLNRSPDLRNSASDFPTGRQRKINPQWEPGLLQPKVEPIQPTSDDLDNDILGSGLGIGEIAQLNLAGLAVSSELGGSQSSGRGDADQHASRMGWL